MPESIEILKNSIKSRSKCIWIETYEEAKFINAIKEIALSERAELLEWSHVEGHSIVPLTTRSAFREPDPSTRGDKIFNLIMESQKDTNKRKRIFILKDLHLIINNHQFIRFIRDCKENNSINYCPIIVLSPIVDIPIELTKLFKVIKYELPNKQEVGNYVNSAIISLKNKASQDTNRKIKIPENKTIETIKNTLCGLTENEILNTISYSVACTNTLDLNIIKQAKIDLIAKSGILSYKTPDKNLSDIGGNNNIKSWLEEVKLTMNSEAIDFGCTPAKGYLALGIPGCSKTVMAEAFAKELEVPFIRLEMSRIMDKLVGQSERNLSKALDIVKACSPCILLIDEIEKALGGVRSSNASDSGTTARCFEQVLQFLNDDTGVFTIMTSNDVSQLPPELSRVGRLDAIWYFGLPNMTEREEILKIHLRRNNRVVDDNIISDIIEETKNFTGSEIEQIVKSAIRKSYLRSLKDGNKNITKEDLLLATEEIVPLYESSREQVYFLEQWSKGRARITSKKEILLEDNSNDKIYDFNITMK